MLSCKKKDVTPPSITILGDSTVIIALFTEYVDSGIIATDDKSSVYIDEMTNLKIDSIGNYYYRFVVTDESGNYSVFSRNIIVELQLENVLGIYKVTEVVSSGPNEGTYGPYEITFLSSNGETNKVLASRFGGYPSDTKATIFFTAEGELNIPVQPFQDGSLSGDGNMSANGKNITISYQLIFDNGTDVGIISGNKLNN